jgi:hypothetical protein
LSIPAIAYGEIRFCRWQLCLPLRQCHVRHAQFIADEFELIQQQAQSEQRHIGLAAIDRRLHTQAFDNLGVHPVVARVCRHLMMNRFTDFHFNSGRSVNTEEDRHGRDDNGV